MKSFFTDFRNFLLAGLYSVFITIGIFFLATQQLSAQSIYQGGQAISIDVNNSPIENVLSIIEKESSYRFMYNSDLKDLQRKVSITMRASDVRIILNQLLSNTNLTYTLMENNLIIISELTKNSVKNSLADDDRIITGKVSGDGGIPLAGVSISIKGTNKGATTDNNGNYSINVSDSDVLVFSYVGYETKEVSVSGKLTLDVSLTARKEDLAQVVVVGYGIQRKIDVTGSVGQVKGSELVKQPVLTATQAIQGKVAGVQVVSSGQPGSSPQIVIRGSGSILGGANPLYVVDGLVLPPGDGITNINTADIVSVDVLKDASSSAIYGARAANGVILITTRQGQGKMKVNYNVNVGMNQAAYIVPMADANEYINYVENTTGLPINSTGYSTDWYKQVLRNAFYQDHNISVAGSSDKNKYFFSGSYIDNEGIVIASDYKRYTFRLNNEFTPSSIVKIGTSASFSNSNALNVPVFTTAPTASSIVINNYIASITEDAYRASPLVPAIANGKYGNTSQYQNVGNPVLDAYNAHDITNTNKIQGIGYIEIKPIPSITLKSSFGGQVSFIDETKYTYQHPNDTTFFTVNGGSQGASRSTLDVTNLKSYDWSWDNTITYNKSFNKSKITILGGTTAEKYYQSGITGTVYDVPPIESLWYLQNGNANTAPPPNSAGLDKITRFSYIGRAFYSYADKYLFTGTFRADASSVFSSKHQWGYFPGVSAGWVLTKEDFMANQHFFQFLKLRAGWGELGNSNINSDAAFSTVYSGSGVAYFFNGAGATGSAQLQLKDVNIQWEVTKETDLGLEYSILNGKLSGEIDFYDKRVNNALILVRTAGDFGNTGSPSSNIEPRYSITNVANIDNKGFEVSANWNNKVNKDLSYSIGANVSVNKNKVLNLNGGTPIFDQNINGSFVTETKAGYPIGAFFVRQVIGVFQNQEEIDNYKDANGHTLQPGAQPGDFIYKYTSDGVLDTVYAGSYQPKLYVGLNGSVNYKNFDFSIDIYSNIGNQVYNGKQQLRVSSTDNVEESVATTFWTPQNGSKTQPRANEGNLPASTYFIASGTFVRINNITLGYTIPPNKLSKQKVFSSCRIFLNAQNPVTLKKYGGFTSELPGGPTTSGVEISTYPTVRTFAAGVNIGI